MLNAGKGKNKFLRYLLFAFNVVSSITAWACRQFKDRKKNRMVNDCWDECGSSETTALQPMLHTNEFSFFKYYRI